jgi:hypothetical protein
LSTVLGCDLVAQIGVGKRLVADEVDALDLGDVAFIDLED